MSFKNNQKPRSKFFVWLGTKVYFLMSPLLFFLGFTCQSTIKMKISDVFADYQPVQDTRVAPIVVSNHVSWADMFFYLGFKVSFLSKESVAHAFLIGWHAITRQSIFLNRDDQKDRDKVLQLIKERTTRVREHEDIYPLLIFPEGTCSNGRTLMSFKKGAFFTGDPIKIYVVKYNNDYQVISSIANINPAFALLVTILQPSNSLTLYEFTDHFDPLYSLRKAGVPLESEDAWKYVAKDVKTLMAFISGFETTEDSFRELLAFEAEAPKLKHDL